ncbi:MAG TPA: ESPR-type extended signal peptide-containing protein, partial [Cellvibrionaceae bacterium]
MNRLHRVIWNPTRNLWVVVSELAKSQGKGRHSVGKAASDHPAPAILRRTLLAVSISGLLFINAASAGVWQPPGTGSWSTPANWDLGEVPDINSLAIINNGGTAILTAENLFTNTLRISNNSSVIVDGTITSVLGTQTTLRVTDLMELNNSNFTVRHGSIASIQSMLNAAGENTITVQHSGSKLALNQYETNINSSGGMTLFIRNGGLVDSKTNTLGSQINQSGTVVVDGADVFNGEKSLWEAVDIGVGSLGNGSLTVSNGATVTTQTNRDIKIGRDLSDIPEYELRDHGADALNPDAANTVNTLIIGASAGETAVAPGSVSTRSIVFGQGTNSLVFNHTGSDFQFSPDIIIDHRLLPLPRIDFFSGTTILSGSVLSRGRDIFSNPMDFLGDILIHADGAVSIGNGGGTGWIDGDIINNGTLTFNHAHNRIYENRLSGSGTLIKEGNNRLALTARVNNTGDVKVNAGTLTVTRGNIEHAINDSTLNSINGSIGEAVNSDASANVSGVNAIWNLSTVLIVGNAGSGNLNITEFGRINNLQAVIGDKAGSTGKASVSGNGSVWNNTGNVYLASQGHGELAISMGGLVTTNSGIVGAGATGTAVVSVDGADSRFNSNTLIVGSNGQGTLNLINSGSANISGQVTIGYNAGSHGVLNIGAAAGETPVAAGTLSAGSMRFGSGSGTLVFNHTNNDYSFNESVSGNGSVDIYAGTTRFTEFQTYTGDTTIHGGKLIIGAPGSRGGIAGNIINNGTLDFSRSTSHTYTGDINGSGSITLNNNAQVLTLTGNLTHE